MRTQDEICKDCVQTHGGACNVILSDEELEAGECGDFSDYNELSQEERDALGGIENPDEDAKAIDAGIEREIEEKQIAAHFRRRREIHEAKRPERERRFARLVTQDDIDAAFNKRWRGQPRDGAPTYDFGITKTPGWDGLE